MQQSKDVDKYHQKKPVARMVAPSARESTPAKEPDCPKKPVIRVVEPPGRETTPAKEPDFPKKLVIRLVEPPARETTPAEETESASWQRFSSGEESDSDSSPPGKPSPTFDSVQGPQHSSAQEQVEEKQVKCEKVMPPPIQLPHRKRPVSTVPPPRNHVESINVGEVTTAARPFALTPRKQPAVATKTEFLTPFGLTPRKVAKEQSLQHFPLPPRNHPDPKTVGKPAMSKTVGKPVVESPSTEQSADDSGSEEGGNLPPKHHVVIIPKQLPIHERGKSPSKKKPVSQPFIVPPRVVLPGAVCSSPLPFTLTPRRRTQFPTTLPSDSTPYAVTPRRVPKGMLISAPYLPVDDANPNTQRPKPNIPEQPIVGNLESPKEYDARNADVTDGTWVQVDPKNKYMYVQKFPTISVVKFRKGVVIIREETLNKAKRLVRHCDVRTLHDKTLTQSICQFFYAVQKDLFANISTNKVYYGGNEFTA